MSVTSKWVALHEVSDYLAKGWQEVHIIGGCDNVSLMVSPPPASEPAKVECPNCGNAVSSLFEHYDNGIPLGCNFPKPAQPEPVAAEMPEAVYLAVNALRQESQYWAQNGVEVASNIFALRADALESFWRTHAAQINDEREHLQHEVDMSNVKANMAHATRPAKVGMTVELEMVMLAAEIRLSRSYEGGWAWLESDQREVLRKAIAAVRAQAEQAQEVKLPKVREAIADARSLCSYLSDQPPYGTDVHRVLRKLEAALAELDAAEGVTG